MDLIAKHYFNRNVTTRFIRVMPLTWSDDVDIRIELYGCPGESGRNVYNVQRVGDPEGIEEEVYLFTIGLSVRLFSSISSLFCAYVQAI